MKIVVTGGAGFQGSHLCQALLSEGHEVTILNTLSQKSLSSVSSFSSEKLAVVWGSITDNQSVRKVIREHEVCFHLAANIHVDESIHDPTSYYETNVLGTLNVAKACSEFGAKLIYISSCEVYGHSLDVCTEKTPLHPRSPYAASKAGADCLVQAHSITYNLPTLILRPTNVFGVGQKHGKGGAVIPRFTSQAFQGKPITLYGDGTQVRDFIHITNLIDAYLFLLKKFTTGHYQTSPKIFNIGTNQPCTILSIAHKANEYFHNDAAIKYLPSRPGEVKSFAIGSEKLQSEGFTPKTNLKESLQKYFKTWRVYS